MTSTTLQATRGRLLRSTALAAGAALLRLFTIVLPGRLAVRVSGMNPRGVPGVVWAALASRP